MSGIRLDHFPLKNSTLVQKLEQLEDPKKITFEPKQPDSTCIVAFSSGSTGVPKGIVHTHETLATGLLQNGQIHGLGRPGIRVFQWCAYTFDISLTEIWGTLICGGVMCIPSEHERLNDVEGAMERTAVEWAFFTPSFARFFCRQGYRVKTLKTLAVGGEALTQQDARTFLEDLNLDRVVQVFGPAEFITMFLKIFTRQDVTALREEQLSENVPFVPCNAHSWVVDPEDLDRLAPIGAVGELLIEGPALFTGYLNDATRTEAALVDAPKWRLSMDIGPPVHRIYRSGDLVRYLENGEMRYVSRKDGVVKMRGQFVDLGEIESLLRTNLSLVLEGIDIPAEAETETGVLLVTDKTVPFLPAGDQALVAFIRPKAKETIEKRRDILRIITKVLQNELRKKIPEYMVPRLFYPIDEFPYNASGKLDRKTLAHTVPILEIDKWIRLSGPDKTDLFTSTTDNANAHGTSSRHDRPVVGHIHDEETREQISKSLRIAWLDVLGTPGSKVSTHDDFFQRGGNSMRAMELVAIARRQGVSITVGKIFGNPVFQNMVSAASLHRQTQGKETQQDPTEAPAEVLPFSLLGPTRSKDQMIEQSISQCRDLEVSDVNDILPATPLQADFMASGIKRPGTFVAQTWLEIPSQVPIDRFREIWKQLNENFPTLRCRMVHIESEDNCMAAEDYLVLVNPRRPLDWVHVDDGLQLDTYLAQDRASPMGYGDALVRYAILGSSNPGERGQRSTMVLTMHQCIYDGFTVKRLHQAMNELLNSNVNSAAIPSTPSFAPFIQHISTRKNQQATKSFWEDYFRGYGNGNGGTTKHQALFPFLPDPFYIVEADSLFATNIKTPVLGSNPKHITLPTIVLAAWALVMNHYTGDSDIVLPMHISGRGLPVPGIMDMAFPTIANVPVRVELPTILLGLLDHRSREPGATPSPSPEQLLQLENSPEQVLELENFLQTLQADQIQLATTTVGQAGLAAIATYSDSCQRAVEVCKKHPQGSLDIQYATATFRPDANKEQSLGDTVEKINVEMQVNVKDAKYFSPEDALSLGCYLLDGGVVRLVFVYDSKVVDKEQITDYATKLEGFVESLIVLLAGGHQ
ncbi:NRPS protein [Diaporthe australafricana]|uniref:NRPS protein n=1 Tax=Diaporthe australafricana TaxID=127596 RepID=A0ABR3W506_9PEZI